MKLLTHNMLSSKGIKGVKEGFPLNIEARNVKVCEVEFQSDFVVRLLSKVEWSALYTAAQQLGKLPPGLPEKLPDNYEQQEDFLRKAHHVLLEIDVINGDLVCPETQRKFPITDGIPNMLLNEDEV